MYIYIDNQKRKDSQIRFWDPTSFSIQSRSYRQQKSKRSQRSIQSC